MLAPLPTDTPPHEPVYHCHVATVPKLPPIIDKVFVVPLHVLLLVILTPVGAVERVPTVTPRLLAVLVPQLLPAVTSILPFCPAPPVVTVIAVDPAPEVIVQPVGTLQV
jgi:hypothetical protein